MSFNEWKELKLGDICIKIGSGATPTGGANAYKTDGISFVRSQNVQDFSFSTSGLVFIDEDQAKKLNGVAVERDDVLLNITGDSVARSCIVPNYIVPARVNQHVSILRVDKGKASNKFLLYYIQGIKPYLLSLASNGATRNALTKAMIEQLDIKIPSLPKQKAIAATLSCLDEKIELNNRINKTLEEMAQAIFKKWFVDFEFPDENGQPYKSSGGEMVESELGLIPRDWKVAEMQCICDVRDGTHSSPKVVLNGYKLITSKHLQKTRLNFREAKSVGKDDFEEINKRSKVDRFDILISMIGTVGNIYLVQDEIQDFAIKNVGLFKTSKKLGIYEYVYCHLSSTYIAQYVVERMAGSTQQYISLGELRKIPVFDYSGICKEVIVKFKEIVNPIFNAIYLKTKEIQCLEKLRDDLLPKLMSGEIRVPVEEVPKGV